MLLYLFFIFVVSFLYTRLNNILNCSLHSVKLGGAIAYCNHTMFSLPLSPLPHTSLLVQTCPSQDSVTQPLSVITMVTDGSDDRWWRRLAVTGTQLTCTERAKFFQTLEKLATDYKRCFYLSLQNKYRLEISPLSVGSKVVAQL